LTQHWDRLKTMPVQTHDRRSAGAARATRGTAGWAGRAGWQTAQFAHLVELLPLKVDHTVGHLLVRAEHVTIQLEKRELLHRRSHLLEASPHKLGKLWAHQQRELQGELLIEQLAREARFARG